MLDNVFRYLVSVFEKEEQIERNSKEKKNQYNKKYLRFNEYFGYFSLIHYIYFCFGISSRINRKKILNFYFFFKDKDIRLAPNLNLIIP